MLKNRLCTIKKGFIIIKIFHKKKRCECNNEEWDFKFDINLINETWHVETINPLIYIVITIDMKIINNYHWKTIIAFLKRKENETS